MPIPASAPAEPTPAPPEPEPSPARPAPAPDALRCECRHPLEIHDTVSLHAPACPVERAWQRSKLIAEAKRGREPGAYVRTKVWDLRELKR